MLQSDPAYRHLEGRHVRRKAGNTDVVGRIVAADVRYLYVRWPTSRFVVRIQAKACVIVNESEAS